MVIVVTVSSAASKLFYHSSSDRNLGVLVAALCSDGGMSRICQYSVNNHLILEIQYVVILTHTRDGRWDKKMENARVLERRKRRERKKGSHLTAMAIAAQ